MSLLKTLAAKGIKVTGGDSLKGGCTVKKPKLKQFDEENVIDDHPITIAGTVVSTTKKDDYAQVKVYIVPSRFGIPDGCPHAVKSASGNVFQIATQRQSNPDKQKETVLHLFAAGIVQLNCPVVCIDISTQKSGPNKRDVDPETELTPGRQVEFFQCVAYARKNTVQQRVKASSLVFCGGKVPIVDQKNAVFRALRDSKLAQQALSLMYARRTGYTSPELFTMTVQDCQAVHGLIKNVLDNFQTHEIKGPLGSEAILRDEVKDYMKNLIPGLESYAIQTYETHLQRECTLGSVGIWSIENIGNYHIPLVPLFSFDEFRDGVLPINSILEFSTDEDHASLSIEQFENMPPPAIGANVSAVAIMNKDPSGLVKTNVPFYVDDATGSNIVIHPYSVIVRLAGEIKNAFGIYTPLLGMVVAELWSRCNQIFFLDEMSQVSRCALPGRAIFSTFQPALETSFGPKETCIKWEVENVIDVLGAIRKYGVKVSKEFVVEHTIDRYGSTLCGAGDKFNAEHYTDKPTAKRKTVVPILPPELLTHGFWCINGKAKLTFEAVLDQLPEGCSGEVEFYAIFKGCAQKVEDELFVNNEDREAVVREVARSRGDVQKTVAFYAVVKPTEAEVALPEAEEVPAEPSDSAVESPAKKAKVGAEDDQLKETAGAPQTSDDDEDEVNVNLFGK
jgi:hypothetical protein